MSSMKESPENIWDEIELDKLIPYKNHQFQQYKGLLYTNILESVKTDGVRFPVLVRPAANGKYELLDGYYRVVAAKELGFDTIPFFVSKELTDEEAIDYIYDSSPFGLLIKHGVDVYDSDYKNTENYKKIKEDTVFIFGIGFMSREEYIERFLLTEDDVTFTYNSIYDMGNADVLPLGEYDDTNLAEDIIEELGLIGKEGDKLDAVEFAKRFNRQYLHNLEKGTHKQEGVIARLKTSLSLDLELFDKNNSKHQLERGKIISLIYTLENKHFPTTNILELLSKPSMENIDNSFLGWETYNGKIIRAIKISLEKELTLQAKTHIKYAVYHAVTAWNHFLENVSNNMDIAAEYGVEHDIKGMLDTFELLDEILTDCNDKDTAYSHSPIETLYLKILQHEQTGQIEDILKVNRTHTEATHDAPPEFIEEMIKFHEVNVPTDKIEKYIYDNAFELAKYVFLKRETVKEDRRKIRKYKRVVRNFLTFGQYAKPQYSFGGKVTVLTIISCLQVVTSDEEKTHFKNNFYGHQGKKGTRNSSQHWWEAFKSGLADDALKIYLVRKVVDRWYANIGRSATRIRLREMESACDTVLLKILTFPSLYEMLRIHNCYLMAICIDLDDEIVMAALCIEGYLRNKGFGYIDIGYTIGRLFEYSDDVERTFSELTAMIDNAVNNGDATLHITGDVVPKNQSWEIENERKVLNFKFAFDYEYKICTMTN